MADQEKKIKMKVKFTDDILKGAYANNMFIAHTREEFILDFVNAFPPHGIVNARVIMSPGHLKRVIRALTQSLEKYEKSFGTVQEAQEPKDPSVIHYTIEAQRGNFLTSLFLVFLRALRG